MTGHDAQPVAGPAPPASEQVLEVVRGHPSAEELAALTAVLAAVLTGGPEHGAGRPGRGGAGWASRPGRLRAPLRHGPDAWRRSARPG
jgi:hypothetical protein